MELPCAWQSCICLRAGQPGAKTERIAVKKVRTRRRAVARAPGKASVRGAVARPNGGPQARGPQRRSADGVEEGSPLGVVVREGSITKERRERTRNTKPETRN